MKNTECHINSPTLNRMVIDHLIQHIVSGDLSLSNQLRLDDQLRHQLTDLRSIEINRLAELRGCIRVSVNPSALSRLLRHLADERETEATAREMARRGAPGSMLRTLFHLNSHDVTTLRCCVGLQGRPGRHRQPTADEERLAWEGLRATGLSLDAMEPRDWLTWQEHTGLPLRVLWHLAADVADPEVARKPREAK